MHKQEHAVCKPYVKGSTTPRMLGVGAMRPLIGRGEVLPDGIRSGARDNEHQVLYTAFARRAQKCTENVPVMILGSGASVAHGMPSMDALATELIERMKDDGDAE